MRPPFAQERLRLRHDGRVALELKKAWHDGTRELVFEPLEFLERLAAMAPRPESNLLICHGVLAPRARWRERVVAYGRAAPASPDRIGSGARRTPSCLCREVAFVLIRPARRPIDGGGVFRIACCSPGPARSTREEGAHVHCGIGSWGSLGGRCLSMGDYVMGVGPMRGANAAGAC